MGAGNNGNKLTVSISAGAGAGAAVFFAGFLAVSFAIFLALVLFTFFAIALLAGDFAPPLLETILFLVAPLGGILVRNRKSVSYR